LVRQYGKKSYVRDAFIIRIKRNKRAGVQISDKIYDIILQNSDRSLFLTQGYILYRGTERNKMHGGDVPMYQMSIDLFG
jgi:hypothetical protein